MSAKISLPAILLVSTCLLVGCRSPGEKESVGTIMGATAGGVIGGQFGHGGGAVVGAAIGAIAGSIVGNALGREVDESEARAANDAFARASRSRNGDIVYWENGRVGHWGTYRPLRDGHSTYGNYCREYAMASNINGRIERVYGTACRQPSGVWYSVN
jgi:surface antigen